MHQGIRGSQQGSSEEVQARRKVSCRAAYRLAHYADGLYRSIREQLSSPEMATAMAVIDYKRQQAIFSLVVTSYYHHSLYHHRLS